MEAGLRLRRTVRNTRNPTSVSRGSEVGPRQQAAAQAIRTVALPAAVTSASIRNFLAATGPRRALEGLTRQMGAQPRSGPAGSSPTPASTSTVLPGPGPERASCRSAQGLTTGPAWVPRLPRHPRSHRKGRRRFRVFSPSSLFTNACPGGCADISCVCACA